MTRTVEPEWLDTLPVCDPRAVRSRRDLQRVNRLMASEALLADPLDALLQTPGPLRLVELGAGDGTLMLRLAKRYGRNWPAMHLDLLDLQPVVDRTTLDAYHALGWTAQVIRADVLDWLKTTSAANRQENGESVIVFANLFVHHFDGARLRELLAGIATQAHGFVCLEPRRNAIALLGSHALGLIGCNDVTRHDAVASVRAGFNGHELSAQWPETEHWECTEGAAGLFSHRFIAVRKVNHAH